MDRRSFLVMAGALGLAGCTRQPSEPTPPGVQTTATGPTELPGGAEADARIRADGAAAELALIALYRSAVLAMPARAERLRPLLEQHLEHLIRISPQSPVPEPVPSMASPVTPSEAAADRARGSVGLRDLGAAEADAQQQHAAACEAAEDPSLVRDLCLLSASEAQHVVALRQLRGSARST